LILLVMLLLPATVQAETPEPSGPVQVVENLHDHLLEVMKEADTLGYEGRYQHLESVLDQSLDLVFMAQKSVGRHWKDLDKEQQRKLLDTFRRFTIANYAGRFDGWSGQSFETLGQEDSTHGTVIVRTQLVDPEGEDVHLNYRLRESDGTWRIIDVYLNGTVSELALRRSENSSLISRDGFDALLRALEGRISELAQGGSAS
jgi:phospholipid transport system substrate-binding protein